MSLASVDVRLYNYHRSYSVMYPLTSKAQQWALSAIGLHYNLTKMGRGVIVPTRLVEVVKEELAKDGLTLAEGYDA